MLTKLLIFSCNFNNTTKSEIPLCKVIKYSTCNISAPQNYSVILSRDYKNAASIVRVKNITSSAVDDHPTTTL